MARGLRSAQLNVQALPRPDVRIEPGHLDINWTPHSVEASWEVVEAEVEYVPYRVSVSVNPYPSIEISVAQEENQSFPEEKKKKV